LDCLRSRAQSDVIVTVNNAGNHQSTTCVDLLDGGIHRDLIIASDGSDPAIVHPHCLGPRLRRIGRPDARIAYNEIHVVITFATSYSDISRMGGDYREPVHKAFHMGKRWHHCAARRASQVSRLTHCDVGKRCSDP